VILFCYACHAHAGRVTLAWDGNAEPTLGGYSLSYGPASRRYIVTIDVGNATSHTLTGLHDGKTYYFAVRAYDTTRTIWSGYSNEACKTIATPASECRGAASTSGLIAAYDFEEASGFVAIDASDRGSHGTLGGAFRTGHGRFGKGLFFDGIDDWVTVNDAASLNLTAGMTLEAWVHPDEPMTGRHTILFKEAPPADASYQLDANSDADRSAVGIFIGNQRYLQGGPWLMPDTWAHLAGTYDGIALRLYLNGDEVAHRTQSGPIEASDGVLRIGGNSFWGEFFRGHIDEIRVYNRALNAAEISADMNTPIATSSPPIFLIGDAKKGAVINDLPKGKARAFRATAISSGWVTKLSIHVNKGSSATRLVAGLYSNKNGHPGVLRAQGTLSRPGKRGWKQVAITPAFVVAGRRYWIAILSRGGILKLRYRAVSAGRRSETSAQRGLAALPRRWKTGSIYREGSLSAYGAGHR
jgi:hypothetical protein